jgi:RNA polymerase sigma-70 factor (ECF subfamily)
MLPRPRANAYGTAIISQPNFAILSTRNLRTSMSNSPVSKAVAAWASLNALSDEGLLQRLIAGDSDSLAVLFDRYHRLVYSVAVRIVRDAAEAEDVVQTVFLNIFQAAATFDPLKGILKVWILQYAYHRSLNRRRALSSQGVYLWDELDDLNGGIFTPKIETSFYCEQILMQLKPIQREVLQLTYFEGMTAQEIATLQERSVTTVRHDLYRGLAKLRNMTTTGRGELKEEPVARERGKQIVGTRTI